MGEATVTTRKRPRPFSIGTTLQRRLVYLGIDVPLLVVSIILVIFGLLMVYSASTDYSLLIYGTPNRIFMRQVQVLLISLVLATVMFFLDYHILRIVALPGMGATILMLVLVLFVSDERHGAIRTIWEGSVQPSELAKLMVVVYLSVWLFSKRDKLRDIGFGLVPLGGILGILGGLIIIQPDISAVLTIFFVGGMMFFLAGGELKQIAILILLAAFFGFFIVIFTDTGRQRFGSFLPGFFDPLAAPYHVQRSLEAFYKGGWLGVGIGMADTKYTGLPVPPTDSIFAVVGEETGFFGAFFLVIMYVILLWRGLSIARRAPDELGTLMAAGLSFWIVMESLINMAVMVNLLPFAGNALPFISAGGSNLLVSLMAVGILLNISRLASRVKGEDVFVFSSVVDLRWRNRRRRVSRPRRISGFDGT